MAALTFPSRPNYSVEIDFAINVSVAVVGNADFSLDIETAMTTETTIYYGSQVVLNVGTVGTTEPVVVVPAERVDGDVSDLPRLE